MVLPEPVGPVTSTSPRGWLAISAKIFGAFRSFGLLAWVVAAAIVIVALGWELHARRPLTLVIAIAIPVSLLFYGRLFDLDPSLRKLFTIDMKEQSQKLVNMLDAIVASTDDWDRIVPVLRELGQLHVTYGVKPAHYDTLCSALVWA